jgi:hypothetical protein
MHSGSVPLQFEKRISPFTYEQTTQSGSGAVASAQPTLVARQTGSVITPPASKHCSQVAPVVGSIVTSTAWHAPS